MGKASTERAVGSGRKGSSGKKTDAPKSRVYQLKITLMESDPEIWRRVLVSAGTNLGTLHRVIQTAMGWTDTHLHEFIVKGVSYRAPIRTWRWKNRKTKIRSLSAKLRPGRE